jgi:glutaredoxin 1
MKQMKAKLYTKNGCTYCIQAKTLLQIRNIAYEEINVEITDGAKERMLSECLEANYTPRTYPQIWLDGSHVGGFTELKSYLDKLVC